MMVAATAARVGFGLLFAPFVVAALPGEGATRVFQLLFLQGGLIALLSASAYARGAHLATGDQPVWSTARSLARFLGLGTGVSIAAGVVFLPLPEEPSLVRIALVAMLVAGAASSALAGFLQGVTVVRDGGLAAFLPSVLISAAAAGGLVALWRSQPILAVVAAWSGPQILTCLVLFVTVPSARQVFRRVGPTGRDERSLFAATGAVNAGSVGVAYAFRERWAPAQPDSQAELGFLVVRVTELVYQVLYMAAASVPRWVDWTVRRRVAAFWGRALLLMTGVVAGVLAIVPMLVWDAWALDRFIVAELAVAPARVLTMLCWLSLLVRRTTWAYQASVLAGTMLAFASMAIHPLQTASYGLQAFHLVNLVAAVVVVLAVGEREAKPATHVKESRQ